MYSSKLIVCFLIGLILRAGTSLEIKGTVQKETESRIENIISKYQLLTLKECQKNATIAEQTFALTLNEIQQKLKAENDRLAADNNKLATELEKARMEIKIKNENSIRAEQSYQLCVNKTQEILRTNGEKYAACSLDLDKTQSKLEENQKKCIAEIDNLRVALEKAESENKKKDEELESNKKCAVEKLACSLDLNRTHSKLEENKKKCIAEKDNLRVALEKAESESKNKDEQLASAKKSQELQLNKCTTEKNNCIMQSKEVAKLSCLEKRSKHNTDYTFRRGFGAYKFYSGPQKWDEAKSTCEKEGAHLAILDSKEEAQILNNLFREWDIREVWIGIHRDGQHGQWKTVLGKNIYNANYPWGKGEPNNSHGKEYCGSLLIEDPVYINDDDCNYKFAFICELEECR